MERRSPIEEAPLRNPGQSLDEYKIDVVLDRILMPAMAAVFLVVLWLQDLWRAYQNVPPKPLISGILALVATGYAGWKIRGTLGHVRNIRLAIEGEKSVGQGLEQLREAGYAVYHDIPGKSFNVDHILVGPAGIFTLETKTWSKPVGRKAIVRVEGDAIIKDGRTPSRDPVSQARAQARWIAKVLAQSTGREFPVFPVVVLPGWWVDIRTKPSHLWIINDKALPSFLARESPRMSNEQISMAKSHLEAFIRAQTLRRDVAPATLSSV